MEENNKDVYLYCYDENGKYINKELAELDTWQTEIKGEPVYKAKAFATFEIPEFKDDYTPYIKDGKWELVTDPTLENKKEEKILAAKVIFASKRDAIRYISVDGENTYGFDTESEDITNFMAAWKAADISGSTMYKVWLDKENKGIVVLTNENFATVFKYVRDSQFKAYAWLQDKIDEIEKCSSTEELEKISLDEKDDEVVITNED